MRHGSSGRRSRNRGGNSRRNNQQRNQVFDSNGPDVRIRGTAHQVAEKYEALAKDAASAGDVTMAQNYMQHAEHYIRIIASWEDQGGQSKQDTSAPRVEKAPEAENEDLGLPASIIGNAPKEEIKQDGELEAT